MKSKLLFVTILGLSLNSIAQIPTSGLVGNYSFSGNANDVSGNANNGTMTNGALFTTDRLGNSNSAVSLDGVDDYIALPSGSSTSLNITVDFSVSFWVKTSDLAGCITSIGNNVTNPYEGYISGIDGGSVGSGKIGVSTRGTWTGSTNTINNNNWHNVIYTLQGGTLKIYIDNILDKQVTGILTPLSWSGSRVIGCRNDLVMTAATNYDGLFDDLLIYNRALTGTEVEQVYTSNCSTPDINTGLVAQYDFTGNANDLSGNNNNGTVNGATLSTDRFGNPNNAYSFNGITDNISVLNSTSLNFETNNKFSLSYWINPVSLSSSEQSFILCKQNSMGANQDGWNSNIMTDYTTNYRIQNGTSTSACSFGAGTPLVLTNQYQHIVQVYDNGTSYVYMNGTLINQSSCAALIGDNTSNMLIGMPTFTFTNSKGFTGAIDDIRIYSRALSVCDVDSLYIMPNTQPTGVSSLTYAKYNFKVYPNPASEKVTIEFNSNESKQMNVELFDLLGKNVCTFATTVALGENKIELNLEEISNGIYFVKINNSVEKIQVNR